jgi:Arc/MetJ-type ribon-helix-helix transcriptional regulator
MTIELPASQVRTLKRLLKTGAYASPSQVLAEGFRLLEMSRAERELVQAELKWQILAGVEQVRSRRLMPFDKHLVADIKRRGRERLAAAKPARRSRA